MRFGARDEFAIRPGEQGLEIVDAQAADADTLLVHDEGAADPACARRLSQLGFSQPGPLVLGVFRNLDAPVFGAIS